MTSYSQAPFPTFSEIPYDKRWEPLKPYLEQIYVIEKRSVKEVIDLMKTRHQFHAFENQYKRRFGVWGWRKNVPTSKKAAVCDMIQTRAKLGKTTTVTYKGQEVNSKQIRRYAKDKARQSILVAPKLKAVAGDIDLLHGHALQCGPRVFLNWNIPYIATRPSTTRSYDPFSPGTVSDIMVTTPSSQILATSPGNTSSIGIDLTPKNAASPTILAVLDSEQITRANLFILGQHSELFENLNYRENITMTNWLYQYWLISFKTAKNWNIGPKQWTASMLYQAPETYFEGQSPGVDTSSPGAFGKQQRRAGKNLRYILQAPSSLCHWSIHVPVVLYQRIPSPAPPIESENLDLDDEESWTPWVEPKSVEHFAETLQSCLTNNSFSNIEPEDLPVSSVQIVRATERSPDELLHEAFGFAIMGHNMDLVIDILNEHDLLTDDFAHIGFFPVHLAATYLAGSKICCNILRGLVEAMPLSVERYRLLYINHLGHTVLDSLMISILKAHTSCTPDVVDNAFKKEARFAGEEVDICGRWDADSKCIRDLYAQGHVKIPFEWKHMFCHTSVKAICHCIGAIFDVRGDSHINAPSGIFSKRCMNEHCGMKLQLLPLHALVITAFHLATKGSADETLFGMLACLLSLISYGANPLLKAPISLNALLGQDDNNHECNHMPLDPLELTEKVPIELVSGWHHNLRIGWKVFCRVLSLAHQEWKIKANKEGCESDKYSEPDNAMDFEYSDTNIDILVPEARTPPSCWRDEEQEDDPATNYNANNFGENRDLSVLWAAVQTEFLTYRRLKEGDSWISPNFDMEALLYSFDYGKRDGTSLGIKLVQDQMMTPDICGCGRFPKSVGEVCVRAEEACVDYFANLEEWKRSTFIPLLE